MSYPLKVLFRLRFNTYWSGVNFEIGLSFHQGNVSHAMVQTIKYGNQGSKEYIRVSLHFETSFAWWEVLFFPFFSLRQDSKIVFLDQSTINLICHMDPWKWPPLTVLQPHWLRAPEGVKALVLYIGKRILLSQSQKTMIQNQSISLRKTNRWWCTATGDIKGRFKQNWVPSGKFHIYLKEIGSKGSVIWTEKKCNRSTSFFSDLPRQFRVNFIFKLFYESNFIFPCKIRHLIRLGRPRIWQKYEEIQQKSTKSMRWLSFETRGIYCAERTGNEQWRISRHFILGLLLGVPWFWVSFHCSTTHSAFWRNMA